MITLRVNILSVSEKFPPRELDRLILRRVEVFSTKLGCIVGYADDFERRGDDIWATLSLTDGTPDAARATAIVGLGPSADAPPILLKVMYTDLPRETLVSLVADSMRARGFDTEPHARGFVDMDVTLRWSSKRRAADKAN